MSIYHTIDSHILPLILEYKNFVPTRLYIKKLGDLLYFGKTVKDDLERYKGGGKRWNNHIRKHGSENVQTIWVSDWYNDQYQIQYDALRFSIENDIVKSKLWANLIYENGIDGGKPGKVNPNYGKIHTDEAKLVMSTKRTACNTGREWYNNGIKNIFRKENPDQSMWQKGRIIKCNPFQKKNWVNAIIISTGEKIRADKNDTRFTVGELKIWQRFSEIQSYEYVYVTPFGNFYQAQQAMNAIKNIRGGTISKLCSTPKKKITRRMCEISPGLIEYIGKTAEEAGFHRIKNE